MVDNYIKIDSLASLDNISTIRLCITSFFTNLDIHMDELMDIKTALSEAVTNAIEHAYDNVSNDTNVITEATIIDDENIVIKVKDFGKGIDNIELAMTPAYTSKPDAEHAGMGFTIMESFMDEVIVDSKKGEGTTIILSKKIRKRKTKT